MAEYILDVLNQTSKLDWAFPFQRTGAFPLDRSAVFSSLADAQAYAVGDGSDERELGGTSYVGQIISVYEAAVGENGVASTNAYIITPERGLLKLAATTSSGDLAADIAALEGKLNSLETTYNAKFASIESNISNLQAADETINEAINNVYVKSEIDSKVSELNNAIIAEKDRAEAVENGLSDEIDAILLNVATKANSDDVYSKSETYTKTEVQTYVAGQIGSAGHLKRLIVLVLPTENIDVDTIYMVARNDVASDDIYNEYMYIDGAWEIIGNTTVDLSEYAKSADVQTSVDAINESIREINAAVANKADASVLEALKGEVTAIKDAENGILAQAKAYTIEEIAKVNETLETKVDNDTYVSDMSSLNTTINAINASIGGDDGLAARLAAVESGKADKATTLAGYGITDAYTKTETDTKIADAVKSATGGESAASVLAALEAYKTSNDAAIQVLQAADTDFEGRITVLENAGGEANVLEAINFNGQDIAIVDKKATFSYEYNLPVAMADALGGVKSSVAENQISVDAQGVMEVNSLNVNKLAQTEGDTLILNGGSANL